MDSSAFLASVETRMASYTQALSTAIGSRTEAELRSKLKPDDWSPVQIIEHMVLGNTPYLPLIGDTISNSPRNGGRQPIKHSLFGKMIIHFAGPNGNGPAPPQLIPSENPAFPDVLIKWREQQEQFMQLAKDAQGIDLARVGVRNPFIKWGRMNLADCFEICTVHTDRHVGQIVDRLK